MTVLTSKTALVTGASSGIGEAVVRALDAAGARVILTSTTAAGLHGIAADLHGDPLFLPANLAKPGAGTNLAQSVLELTGGVDVLVNNAGIATGGAPETLTEEDVDEVFAVNFRSHFMLTVALGSAMTRRGGGSVISISSVASQRGPVGRVAYAASKGAIDAMTRALAADWGSKGIRVNAVNPGIIKTQMWEESQAANPGRTEQSSAARTALKRLGTPEDVADVVVFLASDAARYITGETILVDGGLANTIARPGTPAAGTAA